MCKISKCTTINFSMNNKNKRIVHKLGVVNLLGLNFNQVQVFVLLALIAQITGCSGITNLAT
ncbi:hypothetical protein GCM10011501_22830 [Thalassotalea profundi]|uniref:Uncharacterized protein n=1 Tax=Thalassotalea profundi TaxID=2036687 RepID=A0ABQ3IW42_9GAMM|nr:hypothetical protein GCM10011501_22830 [Thalassotalea profundi]